MKISKLFHWLYASVMFLPLVIIPLFGIWSINHDNNTNITIEVPQNELVNYSQLLDVNNVDNSAYGLTIEVTQNVFTIIGTSTNNGGFNLMSLRTNNGYLYPKTNHKFLITNYSFTPYIYVNANGLTSVEISGGYRIVMCSQNNAPFYIYVNSYSNGRDIDIDIDKPINIFDLTEMFGVGNEPNISAFLTMFPNFETGYVAPNQVLVENTSAITYSDTDIGSQFLYTLYNSTEKYLNFDNVLNLGAISDWINQNVFNGNAPLVFYIVWHYLDYWLILSIFWLCFDVLIYVPNIAHRWLDKASLE